MKKKIITCILLLLGILMIILGLIAICQCDTSHGLINGSSEYSYTTRASTKVKFGADFYTTSAQYTGLAANAVCDLYTFVSCAFGIFFMFIGGLDLCLTLLFANVKEIIAKPITKENVTDEKEDATDETLVASNGESLQSVQKTEV